MTKWISRASVMRIIDADPVYSDVINEKTYMASQINNLPTKEEISRPHGEWTEKTGMRPPEDKGVKFCSNCMNRQPRDFITHTPIEPDFCPNCGADMREEGDSDA